MTGVLIQRGEVGTDMHTGKMPCEYEGHVKVHPGNVSTSPGKPHFASKPQKLEERHGTDSPPESTRPRP